MDSRRDKKTRRPSQRARYTGRKENSGKKAKSCRKEGGEARKACPFSRNSKEVAQITNETNGFLRSVRNKLFELESQIFLIERFGAEDMEEEIYYLMHSLDTLKLLLGIFINIRTK